VNEKCIAALKKELTKDECLTKRSKMLIVMCKARELMEKGKDRKEAMEQAWKEIKEACSKLVGE
jgi:hypothetical protein